MIKIFNQEENESGKQESRKTGKDREFECGCAFDSLTPARSVTSGRTWKERRGIRKAGTQERLESGDQESKSLSADSLGPDFRRLLLLEPCSASAERSVKVRVNLRLLSFPEFLLS